MKIMKVVRQISMTKTEPYHILCIIGLDDKPVPILKIYYHWVTVQIYHRYLIKRFRLHIWFCSYAGGGAGYIDCRDVVYQFSRGSIKW